MPTGVYYGVSDLEPVAPEKESLVSDDEHFFYKFIREHVGAKAVGETRDEYMKRIGEAVNTAALREIGRH